MSEEPREEWDKTQTPSRPSRDMIWLPDSPSINRISRSITQGYEALSSTFSAQQKNIADSIHFSENVQYLASFADSIEKSARLAEQQRQGAVEDARKQRTRVYISAGIAIVAIITTIVLALWQG